tara:strand:- start:89 stop:454 length:366 start_codon:yes stop_codon:yes gene_type:complete
MAIIRQEDSKHTVQLTGQDLANYLSNRSIKAIEPEEEEEKKYQIVELDEQFDSYDEAIEFCYQEEIIYYYNAIKYLSENDSSLRESLDLAHDMGCTLENLSSETLATLHYQNYLVGEIEEI